MLCLPAHAPRVRRGVLAGLLAACALLLSGCQVRVATEVVVDDDGAGSLALTVALDSEIVDSLTQDGFDPFEGLASLPEPWQGQVSDDADGGRSLRLAADFDSPSMLAELVDGLQEGLDEEDPAVLADVQLRPQADGWRLGAMAGLRPPSTTGLVGGLLQFDGQALQELLERDDDPVMAVELRVRLPGRITDTNADEVDGGTATWRLAPTELAAVHAVSEPVPARTPLVVAGAVVVVAVIVGVVIGRRSRGRASRSLRAE